MTMLKMSAALLLVQPLFVGHAHAVASPPGCQGNTSCPGDALYVANAGTYQSESATTNQQHYQHGGRSSRTAIFCHRR